MPPKNEPTKPPVPEAKPETENPQQAPAPSSAEVETKAPVPAETAPAAVPVQPIYVVNANSELEREVLELNRAKLNLETSQLEIAAADRAYKQKRTSETLEQREAQLAEERRTMKRDAKGCNHRQGGTRNRPRKGNGPTALKRIILPMTEMVRCGVCRMSVYPPHPYEGVRERRDGESILAFEHRLEKFEEAKERFAELVEQMEDNSMTEEAAAPLNCGAEFRFYNRRMEEVFPKRPNDTYALQY